MERFTASQGPDIAGSSCEPEEGQCMSMSRVELEPQSNFPSLDMIGTRRETLPSLAVLLFVDDISATRGWPLCLERPATVKYCRARMGEDCALLDIDQQSNGAQRVASHGFCVAVQQASCRAPANRLHKAVCGQWKDP